jgi:hypothetical protein
MTFKAGSHAGHAVVAVLGTWATLAHAHHSNTAFDTARSVDWSVTVTEFKFVNPHAYVYFTMPDQAGKTVAGRCELSARTALTRMGWTIDTLQVGEKITIRGAPGRNEAQVCMVNSIVRANGTEIGAHQPLARPAP